MQDQSDLDKKYFIDETVYNCPFCNRRHVAYTLQKWFQFDWSKNKKCFLCLVQCNSCDKVSMHLSYSDIIYHNPYGKDRLKSNFDIDSHIFYSVPTSFFVVDKRIHKILRELITEAEGCLKMNYLTGASTCTRKAIYELLVLEKAEGDNYQSRIKFLKKKYPNTDPSLFDILGHIQDMTSDKIHEQSWDAWDSKHLKLIIETLKTVLYDIYVVPEIKKERLREVQKLQQRIKQDKTKE